MKAIFKLRNLILAGIVLMAGSAMGQSLLPAGPTILKTNCEDPNTIVADVTLTTQPDTFISNNFTILTYLWTGPANTQTGNSNTYVAAETGAYVLTVDALRLSDSVRVKLSDTIQIVFDAVCCEARLPNAFTPNGDNKNDVFAPVLPEHCVFQEYQLQVYNRWGKKVFDTNLANTPVSPNTQLGWDGKIDGKDAPSDVYVYWLRYTSTGNNNTFIPATFKGDVTLIR